MKGQGGTPLGVFLKVRIPKELWACFAEVRIPKGIEGEAVRESGQEMYPHPRCFLKEWQTKDLGVTESVRVSNKGVTRRHFSGAMRG
jgi:hypothetical protein